MLQEQGIWDYRNIVREPSTAEKVFLLYLIFVCVIAIVKLLKAWRPGLGFKRSPNRATPEHLHSLQTAASSLGRWIGLIFLSWGLLTSINSISVCSALLRQETIGWGPIVLVLLDYARLLNWTLYVATFVFLIRWQLLKRIQQMKTARTEGLPEPLRAD